jgi:carbamoyltransferase
VRERIHRAVKEREPFRPFAPAVLASRAHELFDGVHLPLTRFMTGTARAKEPGDPRLGAVVHVDGTARVQTVDEKSAPALEKVLRALEARTGDCVVLNTSLNAVGEPLCATAMDAVAFFLGRPVDALVIEDVAIVRPPGGAS